MSLLIIYSSHPVIIIAMILVQSLLTCVLIWFNIKNRWISFVLFLIFLGGLIVLFIYITSLAYNEKFRIKLNDQINFINLTILLIIIFNLNFFEKIYYSIRQNLYDNIIILFNSSLIFITLIIIRYLLLTLIVVVKVASKIEAPLRSFIN